MDKSTFFDSIRHLFGGKLTAEQVAGMETILNASPTDMPQSQLAYCLATVFHETDQKMQPIEEYGKGRGKKYGKKDASGQIAYGRGLVQLTWPANYKRADEELELGGKLIKDYSLALDPLISVKILFKGMSEGWFTGKKLSDYFNDKKTDALHARQIINSMDCAAKIQRDWNDFNLALTRGQYDHR